MMKDVYMKRVVFSTKSRCGDGAAYGESRGWWQVK